MVEVEAHPTEVAHHSVGHLMVVVAAADHTPDQLTEALLLMLDPRSEEPHLHSIPTQTITSTCHPADALVHIPVIAVIPRLQNTVPSSSQELASSTQQLSTVHPWLSRGNLRFYPFQDLMVDRALTVLTVAVCLWLDSTANQSVRLCLCMVVVQVDSQRLEWHSLGP